ncbi:hypothetical protein WU87_00605 [Corynebacterium minutissimum]|uniref:Uncharacterized protein n=1 Tax=Corynebacterium minutissimum TaxID=38301 RepID=A0ACC4UDF6_9CORY|nr:hypothetical protein WU87_00605 [Corynebacterium minutissimum]
MSQMTNQWRFCGAVGLAFCCSVLMKYHAPGKAKPRPKAMSPSVIAVKPTKNENRLSRPLKTEKR